MVGEDAGGRVIRGDTRGRMIWGGWGLVRTYREESLMAIVEVLVGD